MDYLLQNAQYYHQQLVLWIDFSQQAKGSGDEPDHFLRQVWDRCRDSLADYLQINDPNLVDYLMVFIDGLILQYLYNRGNQDKDWFEHQSQLMMQMVLLYVQSSCQFQV
jgi:hypothetical protein